MSLKLGLLGVAAIVPFIGWKAFDQQEADLGTYSTDLSARTSEQRHNAIRALEELQGIVIAPGDTFSFNHHVRGWTKDMGYRKAPVSYNGQLVDAWGGGVCQTSTTLYNAALLAGLPIVERNRHRFAPSYVLPGRDAAVAYENIDLKFKNPYEFPIRITGRVSQSRLWLSIKGDGMPNLPLGVIEEIREQRAPMTFRVSGPRSRTRNTGKSGYDVVVWREWGDRRELISQDDYPAMHRIEEH